jgi:hypothetical protein
MSRELDEKLARALGRCPIEGNPAFALIDDARGLYAASSSPGCLTGGGWHDRRLYSTDWTAMGELIGELVKRQHVIDLLYHPDASGWSVMIGDRNTLGDTLPHTLARAALVALGGGHS